MPERSKGTLADSKAAAVANVPIAFERRFDSYRFAIPPLVIKMRMPAYLTPAEIHHLCLQTACKVSNQPDADNLLEQKLFQAIHPETVEQVVYFWIQQVKSWSQESQAQLPQVIQDLFFYIETQQRVYFSNLIREYERQQWASFPQNSSMVNAQAVGAMLTC